MMRYRRMIAVIDAGSVYEEGVMAATCEPFNVSALILTSEVCSSDGKSYWASVGTAERVYFSIFSKLCSVPYEVHSAEKNNWSRSQRIINLRSHRPLNQTILHLM